MHALVATWKLNAQHARAHQQDLEERIVPLTRHQPGFLGGTWSCDQAGARALSHLLFATEAQARGFGDYLTTHAAQRSAGAELESVVVAEVLAAAGVQP